MLKVAFATSDGIAVDQHYGWANRFDVYEINAVCATLVESRYPQEGNSAETRIECRLEVIRDCAILHVANIGGAAAAKIVHARIHPLKVAEGTAIDELLERLRAVLAGNPPPWLRRILNAQSAATPVWTPR